MRRRKPKKISKKVKLSWNKKSHYLDGGWKANADIAKAQKMAKYELLAKERGVPLSRVIAESL